MSVVMQPQASTSSNRRLDVRAEIERMRASEQVALIELGQMRGLLEDAKHTHLDLLAKLTSSKKDTADLALDKKLLLDVMDVNLSRRDVDEMDVNGRFLSVCLLEQAVEIINRKNALRLGLLEDLRELRQRLAASLDNTHALHEQVADANKTIAHMQLQLDKLGCAQACYDDDNDAMCADIWYRGGTHNSDDVDDSTFDFAAMMEAAREAIRATRP